MNIIKFKDIVIDRGTTPENITWFNDKLRGRYAYWVRCRYVVAMSDIPQNVYVGFETTINNLEGYTFYGLVWNAELDKYEYIFISLDDITENQKRSAVLVTEVPSDPTQDSPAFIYTDGGWIKYADLWEGNFSWLTPLIDIEETDRVNDVKEYKIHNDYIPDDDITIDELKCFRTWVAQSMLDVRDDWSDDERHMLQYYAGGMSDEVVKWLTQFASVRVSVIPAEGKTCGCSGTGNLSSLYGDALSVCDSLSIYRDNIKKAMITLFSKIETWEKMPAGFLTTMIKYLQGIIKANLPLTTLTLSDLWGCECVRDPLTGQTSAQALLGQLISALTWIRDGKISGHKNNITTTLTHWSTELYERMEWS